MRHEDGHTLFQWSVRGCAVFLMQRLRQGASQNQSERKREAAHEKRDAPAIGVERGMPKDMRKPKAHGAAGECCETLAARLERCEQPAAMHRRGLEQIGRRRPDLATEREALRTAGQKREHRRPPADRRVRRNERHGDDGHAHQSEAEQHRGLAAGTIAIRADHQAADRAHQEPCRKNQKRQRRAHVFAELREKRVPDLDREGRVNREVVEFERIAHHGRYHVTDGKRPRRLRGHVLDTWLAHALSVCPPRHSPESPGEKQEVRPPGARPFCLFLSRWEDRMGRLTAPTYNTAGCIVS